MKYEQPTRVILVRHGRSTYNDQGRYQGSSDDSVLTAQGHKDAYRTGLALQYTPISTIYTSPLQRTRQTTEAIQTAVQGGPHLVRAVRIDPCLQEIYLPEWQGLAYRHVREVLQEHYQRWVDHPDQFQMTAPLNGTKLRHSGQTAVVQSFRKIFPVRQLYHQAQYFWRRVLPRHMGDTILVVSHGGTIRALLHTALGIDCKHYHRLQQSNCGISMLEFSPANQAQVTMMNDTHHLDEILPKLKEGKQGLRLLLISNQTDTLAGIQRLRAQIAPIEIQFCLSNGDRAQAVADQLLGDDPKVIQLHSAQPDAHLHWLRSLQNRQGESEDRTLITGVMIASPEHLAAMVGQLMGDDHHLPIQFDSNHMSILHFPTTRKAPVLQSLNFGQISTLARCVATGEYYPCAS